MNYQAKDFSYSTKNIPLASKSKYLQTLIKKTESLIHRMRWKAFFFLHNHDTNSNEKETYGFTSKRPLPHVSVLDEFEDNMLMIQRVEFKITCAATDSLQANLIKTYKKFDMIKTTTSKPTKLQTTTRLNLKTI